jgi:hypothetical protein
VGYGVVIALATALCFALAQPIARVLGKTGINVMTRLMGLILAALAVDNDASPVEVNYIGESINKAEDPQWIVFPWEEWWKG